MSRHTCPDCGKTDSRRFEGKQLRCKECGTPLTCPVCEDGEEPAGWFKTEDGEVLACHACNHAEMMRQQRQTV